MTDIPAGWYDDPEFPTQFRYWDGHQWTEHRSPKSSSEAADSGESAWGVVPAAFRLLGAGWRQLVVLALPLVFVSVAAGLLAVASIDSTLEPGLGEILDRVSEPGFDPVDDAADEQFIDSIEFSVGGAAIAGVVAAGLLLGIGALAATVAFNVFFVALHAGRTLSVSATYRLVGRRLLRVIGILLLWWLGAAAAAAILAAAFIVAVLVSPWLLLVLIPATLAAAIYLYPFVSLLITTLSVAPTTDPPLRRTFALVRPMWGALAGRLLILALVSLGISFVSNIASTPFGAASIWAGVVVAIVLQAIQTVFGTAGAVVLYGLARGPVDPAITEELS